MPVVCGTCGKPTKERECDVCEKPLCMECAKFMATYVEDYLRRRQVNLRVCPSCKISFKYKDELLGEKEET